MATGNENESEALAALATAIKETCDDETVAQVHRFLQRAQERLSDDIEKSSEESRRMSEIIGTVDAGEPSPARTRELAKATKARDRFRLEAETLKARDMELRDQVRLVHLVHEANKFGLHGVASVVARILKGTLS